MKIAVAMSGGLDSSVAAALLKKRGLDVLGVFMKLVDSPLFIKSEKRAKRIAKILGIPFLSLDLRKEFKKRIVDCFLKEYRAGRTPNPCVICNKEIKFGLLLKKTLALNADYVSTGHYARKKEMLNSSTRPPLTSPKAMSGAAGAEKVSYRLLKGKDKEKDQSYFLWMLNQEQLKNILFPIGDYTRKEVEKLAKKFKLPVSSVKKSVEICFVPERINDFLKRHLKEKPGPIVSFKPDTPVLVREHRGLWFYTIGQRKGIRLPGGPYYVLHKNLNKNILIVTKKEKDLYKKDLIAENVNWISGRIPELPMKIKAKIRYRHKSVPAKISRLRDNLYHLIFDKSQRAIAPGQSVVFYSGRELLGGGIIRPVA